jgi:hypothetical protein
MASQAYGFAANMAREGVLSPSAVVSIELIQVAGRRLFVPPEVECRCWAEQSDIAIAKYVQPSVLAERSRDLALDVAQEIFAAFRWHNTQRDVLAKAQDGNLRP